MDVMEERNARIYSKAPDQQMIDAYIKKLGISDTHFELFFEIPKGTIRVVRFGQLLMPKKYWHIFYEGKNYVRSADYKKHKQRLLTPRSKNVAKTVNDTVNLKKASNVAPLPDNNRIKSLI